MTIKRQQIRKLFWGVGIVLYSDCGSNYMDMCVSILLFDNLKSEKKFIYAEKNNRQTTRQNSMKEKQQQQQSTKEILTLLLQAEMEQQVLDLFSLRKQLKRHTNL